MKKVFINLFLFMLLTINLWAQTANPITTFKVAALNVDGLPAEISGVSINPDAKGADGATAIGNKLATMDYDVVGLSEDFNYNSYLIEPLAGIYNTGTWRGGLNPNAGEIASILWQGYTANTDGLNLLYKTNINISNETYVKWDAWHGYTNDGADGLIKKGFRYYTITLADGVIVDLYILHMDAETTDGDNEAREKQMAQLLAYIKATDNKRPIIIMGDTNCRYTRDKLKANFINELNADLRFTAHDAWVEQNYAGQYPILGTSALMVNDLGYEKGEIVDKIIYVNNSDADKQIKLKKFIVDTSFIDTDGTPLADHFPVVGEFEVYNSTDFQDELTEEVNTEYYLRNASSGRYLKIGGWWGSHAIEGNYGVPVYITKMPNGKYDIKTANGYIGKDAYMDAGAGEDRAIKEWNLIKKGDYYVLSYTDNGERALTDNDPFYFNDYPNYRYVTNAPLNSNDKHQQWQLLTKQDLMDEMTQASIDNPFNATFLLPGANYDRIDAGNSKWTLTKAANVTEAIGGYDNHENSNFNRSIATTPYSSSWLSKKYNNWKVTQTVNGLPNGMYRVSCQGFYKDANSTTAKKVRFTAGNKSVDLKNIADDAQTSTFIGECDILDNKFVPKNGDQGSAATFFNANLYINTIDMVEVKDGTLTITVEKSENNTSYATWTCIDNFQIEYLGTAQEITLTMTDAGYATLVLPFDAEVPTGITLYTCSSVGTEHEDVLDLEEVNSAKADIPYIVSGATGTYTFKGYPSSTTDTPVYGCLIGTYEETNAPTDCYVLQKHGEKVGFYRVYNDLTVKVNPYRAYLSVANSLAKEFFFDASQATSISAPEATDAKNNIIYDLSGRRVTNPTKGIYIVNGKKVMY